MEIREEEGVVTPPLRFEELDMGDIYICYGGVECAKTRMYCVCGKEKDCGVSLEGGHQYAIEPDCLVKRVAGYFQKTG